jgi:hypothetical protein
VTLTPSRGHTKACSVRPRTRREPTFFRLTYLLLPPNMQFTPHRRSEIVLSIYHSVNEELQFQRQLQLSRRPEITIRNRVLVIDPKFELPTLRLGLPKLGWLKMSKASARNCRFTASVIFVFLSNERSVLTARSNDRIVPHVPRRAGRDSTQRSTRSAERSRISKPLSGPAGNTKRAVHVRTHVHSREDPLRRYWLHYPCRADRL